MERRDFLKLAFATGVLSCIDVMGKAYGIELKTNEFSSGEYQAMIDAFKANPARATETLRPQYHFTPINGWFNDPNGLCFFKGKWHYFMQHSGWGHAVSDDLIHWKHMPPVARTDELGEIWSGSGVVDSKDTSGFFNGRPGYVGVFTHMNASEGKRQSQSLLFSSDGQSFEKYENNPVIPQLRHLEGHSDDPDFRDPKVFWHAPTKRWVMIVAGGKVRFFSSKDLKEWKFESINENIQTECPDMFELPIDGDKAKTKWVLNKGGRGIILGSFDGKKFIPEFPGFALNYGPDFYASQTFSDVPDGRCIMSTWMYHWGIVGWPGRWGGAMTIPVQLKLRTTPEGVRLYQTPVKELESLRYDKYKVENISVSGNRSLPIKTQQLEIVCRFKPGSAKRFGINVLIGRDGEKTVVGYDAQKQEVFVDRRKCGYNRGNMWDKIYTAPAKLQDGIVELRIFIDWCSVETFINGGYSCITTLVAPQPGSDGVELFAEDGEAELVSLEAWKMKSIWRKNDAPGGNPQTLRILPQMDVTKGEKFHLNAEIWPQNAENKNIVWSSSDSSVIDVKASDAPGYCSVLAKKAGEAVITAKTNNGLKEECRVYCSG